MNKIGVIKNSFSGFSLEEKLQITELGKNRGVINLIKLFMIKIVGGDETWSTKGTDDLVHIWDKMKSHEKYKVQMNNVFSFSMLGFVELLSYRGIFKELVNFSAELDNDLKVHIQSSKAFKGTSKTTQNELLECMLDVYHEDVRKEIENYPFVAVIADETTDVACVKKDLENFERAIQGIREQIDSIINNIQGATGEPIRKKARIKENSRKREASEICDAVLLQIKTRFNFSGHLVASNLFMSEKFSVYKNMLKNELQVLYQRDELGTTSEAVPMSLLLNEEGLNCTFQKTFILLSILISIPMSTSEAERCFSMLKRIKTFHRNTMKEEKLSALGMLSAEKHFVNGIENFKNKIIANFATKKERRMDFIYRKL
ncbi:unnamed protein product [Psylliodes chrysocephalus]|uniref:HAT C-terminal dimerisation domain-containing protein n=1 Tax=Psylliodes chrysocephalus TaxID=3402493 RepID=A0A9P0D7U7_9CUCU|nr:unnamed protein product [Psylliodes chrysocephala]